KELEAGIDPARAAPDADDQEHRNEAALEEQVEHHEIERRESTDHQRLEHQERDHVFLDALADRQPARDDAYWHQRGGEHDDRQRYAVDPHGVVDRPAEPGLLLHELELGRAGVEAIEHDQGDREGDERRPQRDPARVAPFGLTVAAHHHDEQRAEQRQEGGDGEDRPAHDPPIRMPNMNQVTGAATPTGLATAEW